MNLQTYLNQNSLSLAKFAKRCGVSPTTILRVRDGEVIPSRRTLTSIVDASGGAITVQELISVSFTTRAVDGSIGAVATPTSPTITETSDDL